MSSLTPESNDSVESTEGNATRSIYRRAVIRTKAAVAAGRLIVLHDVVGTTAAALPTAYVIAWYMLFRVEITMEDLGLRTLHYGDRMIVCGLTAGPTSEISISNMYLRHTHLQGSTMGTQGDLERLVDFVADGSLEPVVGEEYSLEETGQAFADMQERTKFGKLVVHPN